MLIRFNRIGPLAMQTDGSVQIEMHNDYGQSIGHITIRFNEGVSAREVENIATQIARRIAGTDAQPR